MQYLKRNTKYSILAFLVLILSITISISTLAKTEVYPACACLHADRFSLSDNPQKEIIKNINQAQASINIEMYAFPSPAQKIITLREELGGFKELQNFAQIPEISNLEWEEWKEQGIVISSEWK